MQIKEKLPNYLILFFSLIYLIWLFKTYSGNIHSMYIDMYKFTNGDFSYKNDYFLSSSLQIKASILYKIFQFIKLNPDNDYFGFFLHLTFSSLSGYFLYLIIKNHTEITEPRFILIFLFSILLIGKHLVPTNGNTVTWVSGNSMSPTYFAHSMIFFLLWSLLEKRILLLSIISVLMIFIGIKASWYAVGCSVLYTLIYMKPLRKKLWIVAPIISVLYLLQSNELVLNFDEKIFVFEDIVKNDHAETSFFVLNKIYITKIILSFVLFFFMWKKIKDSEFKKFCFTVFIISIFTFVFGYLYFGYGYKIFPVPQIAIISLTRGFGLFELIFWLLIGIHIYKIRTFQIVKILILTLIFYVSAGIKGLIVGSLISLLGFLFIYSLKNIKFFKENFEDSFFLKSNYFKNSLIVIFLIVLAPGILYLGYQKFDKGFSLYSLSKIKKGTIGDLSKNKKRLTSAIKLRVCDDFILYDPFYLRLTSSIAGKSSFTGSSYFNNFDIKLINESKKRNLISKNFKNQLISNETISAETIKKFEEYQVTVLLDKKFLEQFPNTVQYNEIQTNQILINFYNNKHHSEFKINCLSKIN